jgi:hypothetical protein
VSISKKVRDALHQRANSCCEICGAAGATNAHHRKNKSQGGTGTLSGLLLLCGSGVSGCHGVVTLNPLWAARFGYTIRSYENTSKPVLLDRHGWVRLFDDGGLEHVPAAETDDGTPLLGEVIG